MKSLVILHCVDDAKHACLHMKDELGRCLFISTHASVNDYLSYQGIECCHLADFIDYGKIKEIITDAERVVDTLLNKLDAEFSGKLNVVLQANSLRWFYALYRYMGKYEYLGIHKSYEALKNLINTNAFEEVYVYRSTATGVFERENNILEIAKLLHGNCYEIDNSKQVKDYPFVNRRPKQGFFILFFKKVFYKYALGFPSKVKEILDLLACKVCAFIYHRRNILLFLPLLDLSFLKPALRKRGLLVDIHGDSFKAVLSKQEEAILVDLKRSLQTAALLLGEVIPEQILIANIIADFSKNLDHNFSVLKGLKTFCKSHAVKLGIWGNPPDWKTKALMVAYLFNRKIKVIGAQHGPIYCEFDRVWDSFESDFNWCDYFLSYGFEESELRKTYPNREKRCVIVPVGYPHYSAKRTKYETIDLLFPLTINLSFPMEGTALKNSEVAETQKRLLLFLNGYKDKRIVVKPFIGSNDKNSAVIWLLKRLVNLEVISDLSLQQVMERYRVKAFLIESISAPLRDAFFNEGDSQIFVLDNPSFEYFTYTKDFRREIEKSVNIFDDLGSLTNSLHNYLNGSCLAKDVAYYRNRYYERSNPKGAILSLIDRLIADS